MIGGGVGVVDTGVVVRAAAERIVQAHADDVAPPELDGQTLAQQLEENGVTCRSAFATVLTRRMARATPSLRVHAAMALLNDSIRESVAAPA